MKVAKAIAKAREAKGISQAELAKRLHVSAGTVGAWETGRHGVRMKRLRDIAKVLGLPLEQLVA